MTAFWAFKTIDVFRASGWAFAWPITVTTVASLGFGPASSALLLPKGSSRHWVVRWAFRWLDLLDPGWIRPDKRKAQEDDRHQ